MPVAGSFLKSSGDKNDRGGLGRFILKTGTPLARTLAMKALPPLAALAMVLANGSVPVAVPSKFWPLRSCSAAFCSGAMKSVPSFFAVPTGSLTSALPSAIAPSIRPSVRAAPW